MRKFSCLLTSVTFALAACSGAESKTAIDAAEVLQTAQVQTTSETSKSSLFNKGRVDQFMSVTKDMTDAMSLLYTRSAPEIADKIKPAKLPPEARDVFSCVVSKAKGKGLQKQMDESLQYTREFIDYIRSTPKLTIQTLETDPKFTDLQAKATGQHVEEMTAISKQCGVISMNMKVMQGTGAITAISAHMRNSPMDE